MTTPSSCNNFFKKYLFYKLRTQSVTFILSAILNVLMMPPFVIEMMLYYNGIITYFWSSPIPTEYIAIIIFAIPLTAAPRAFSFCTKSNRVDTLGSLPLTRRQHFAADFLSGYIASVGPYIPCAVFSIIIAACTNNGFTEHFPELHNTLYIEWLTLTALALFAAYTFAYLTSVFVTVCCGKTSSSIIFTMVVAALALSSAAGIGSFVVQSITGANLDYTWYLNYIPPLGLLTLAHSYYIVLANIDMSYDVSLGFNPAAMIVLIITGAAMIFASYFIFKKRKAERTGMAMTSNALYRLICALSVITVTSVSFSAAYILHAVWIPLLISIAVTAVLLLILEAVRGFKKAGIIITGVRGLIMLFICFAALMIVDGSGAFGARYINISPNEVETLVISDYKETQASNVYTSAEIENLTFTDQKDIEKFIGAHNQTVGKYYKDLRTGFVFQVYLILKNGKTVTRNYSPNNIRLFSDSSSAAIKALENDVCSLENYSIRASERYKEELNKTSDIYIQTLGIFGEVSVPYERISELTETFTREFREKFSPDDTTAGLIRFNTTDAYSREAAKVIYIPSSCTETLALANELRLNDPSCKALTVSCYNNTKNYTAEYTLDLETLNSRLGQDLLSLLSTDKNTKSSDRRNRYYIISTDLNDYYVPEENKSRFFELLLDLIESKYTEDTAA